MKSISVAKTKCKLKNKKHKRCENKKWNRIKKFKLCENKSEMKNKGGIKSKCEMKNKGGMKSKSELKCKGKI